jgi:hypothetical protein
LLEDQGIKVSGVLIPKSKWLYDSLLQGPFENSSCFLLLAKSLWSLLPLYYGVINPYSML